MSIWRFRKDITPAEKMRYISLAVEDMVSSYKRNPNYMPKTDIIGLACHYTSRPKLKREDFLPIMNMTLNEIVNSETLL